MTEAVNKPYPWLDKLPQLNSLLVAKGITVSADVWVRVYDLFIAQYQQNRLPKDPTSLESALSGLMVTSAEQQQQFKGIYQQWLGDIGSEGAAQAKQFKKIKQSKRLEDFQKNQDAQLKNRSLPKIIAMATLLLAILLAVAVYFWLVDVEEKIIELSRPESTGQTTAAISPPVMALQPIPLRQDLLPKAESVSQQYLLDLIGESLPYLPVGLFIFFLWARWQRWQEVLSQQKGDPKDPLSIISSPDKAESSEPLFSSPLLSNALKALHNPVKVPSKTLSMVATAEATARAGGYFTPKYQQRAYIPPCIMMISYQHGQDQASGLALLMQQRLLHAGLEVHTYLFQGTPEHLYTLEGMSSTRFTEVTARFPQGNLLLISDPDIYLSAWSGELQPWVNTITQWQQRALLTTRPTTQAMRKAFDALQLHSASLSSEGLKQISQRLAGVRKARDISTSPRPLPRVLARLTLDDCGEEVSLVEQQAQIEALHLFCDPQTFRLLTVIAAYPELHWPLTQRIESELCYQQPIEQREQRLLSLLRLPWLRAGKLPKWLRLYCYQQQSPSQQQATQALYRELFRLAEIEAAGNHPLDHLQLPFNPTAAKKPHQLAFMRWLKRLKQAQQSTLEESLWEDQIFVDTLWGKPRDLDVPLSKKLAVRLPQGRWERLYPRVALSVIASLFLGLVLHQVWKGSARAEVEALLPPADLSAQLVNSQIEILINSADKYETGSQLLQFEQQKQAAVLLTKALKQQGLKGDINTRIENANPSNQASRIRYTTGQLELAELAAKQFAHLTWGNAPELSATASNATLQIQLNRLTQAASTFSDQAKPLSDAQKRSLSNLGTVKSLVTLQPFTLFRDRIKQQATARIQYDESGWPISIPASNQESASVSEPASASDQLALPQMLVLPAGTFLMGSPDTEPDRASDESPLHEVTIKAFAISQTEITFKQYDAFADATKRKKPDATKRKKPDDNGWGRGPRPVINVSWNDAKAYTEWLSEQTGQDYRLPSEAEWEYAARAGTQTPFSTGDCIHTDLANYDGTDLLSLGSKYYDCGAKTESYRQQTTEVSELAPNPWGIYAMYGNVYEWVEDCYKDSYVGAPVDGSARQEAECAFRVLRGGGWDDGPNFIRSANRLRNDPVEASSLTGFRIARAL